MARAGRAWLVPPQPIIRTVDALVAPDLLVLALASAVAGALALRGDRRAGAVALVTCGASLYATVYSIRWAHETGAPLLSPLLMLASSILTIGVRVALPDARVFRRAVAASQRATSPRRRCRRR